MRLADQRELKIGGWGLHLEAIVTSSLQRPALTERIAKWGLHCAVLAVRVVSQHEYVTSVFRTYDGATKCA